MIYITGRGDRIGRAQPSHVEGQQFEIQQRQTNTLTKLLLDGCSPLLRQSKDQLAQYLDNATEWDIKPWWWQPGLSVGQHYIGHHECGLLQVGTQPVMTMECCQDVKP